MVTLFTSNKSLNLYLLLTYWAYCSLLLTLGYATITQPEPVWVILIFQSIPLLLVLPGLIKKHYRAHSWLCFIILAYFTAYVVEVSASIAEISDWIGLSLSVLIFAGAMMSSRGLQRL